MASERVELPQIPKFDGNNFHLWKFQLTIILRAQGLLGVVEGSEAKPNSSESGEFTEWNKKNSRAMMLLSTAMDYSQLECLVTCETATEMWSRLGSIHEQKSEANKLVLQQRFYDYRMSDTDTMAQHIAKVESLARQLSDLGEKVSELGIMAKLLGSLPAKYSGLATAWDSVDPSMQTKNNLVARLLKEESRLQTVDETTSAFAAAAISSKGVVNCGPKSSHGTESKSNVSTSRKPAIRCHYCKKIGHIKRNCRAFQKDKAKKHDQGQSQRAAGFSVGNKDREDFDTAFCAECSLILNSPTDDVWLADSGASRHMTSHREWFESYETMPNETRVRLGDNKELTVAGKGNVRCLAYANGKWLNTIICDVLHVPDLKKNLFSVGVVTAKGITAVAQDSKCNFYKQDKLVAIGVRESNHLYRMLFKMTVQAEANVTSTNSLKLWHERLGHVNLKTLKEMASKELVKGLKIDNSVKDFLCESCQYGKQHRLPFRASDQDRLVKSGEFLHTDLCGPFSKTSMGGANYFMVIKDEFTGYRFVYFLKHKSDAFAKFCACVAKIENMTGNKVKTVRSDNGTEYCNEEFAKFFIFRGIQHERTAPYTPEQNGRMERDNRTIVESARSMMFAKHLPTELWAEAVNTAVYLLNRTVGKRGNNCTPYELWFGKKPELSHIRIFGSEAYEHVPKQLRKKWDAKSRKVILVGYQDDSTNYRLYNPVTRKVSVSRDVTFNEDAYDQPDPFNPMPVFRVQLFESESDDNGFEDPLSSPQEQIADHQMSLRPRSNLRQPDRYQACLAELDEPATYSEALDRPDADEWRLAMVEEMDALTKNHTWSLVKLPADRRTIGAKWVFRIKRGVHGEVKRYKARLCAKGYSQRQGIDYNETFSPVVRYDSVRVLLALATIKNLIIKQFDVKCAFLNGDLREEIFMEQPEGFEVADGSLVCKLNKSLYGLKQSPRAWNEKFTSFLHAFSFQQSDADKCVFYGNLDGHEIFLALYVDDGLVMSESEHAVCAVIEKLSDRFEITVCEPDHYVGIEITRDLQNHRMFLSQKAYIERILVRFRMDDSNPSSVPADPNTPLSKAMCPVDENQKAEMNVVPFRQAVGSLMFAAIVTRPDIMLAVSQVSKFLENPGKAHWNAVKRIFKYLNGTKDYGLCYSGEGNVFLKAYSDADYAGDIDSRRSTSGYLCQLAGGPVTWASQRQQIVALSTTESEYVAACDATKEIVWLRRLLHDLNIDMAEPTVLFIDNQSAIRLVRNPEYHKRTKHIDVRFHFIRDQVEKSEIVVTYIASGQQLADMFTKALPRDRFRMLRGLLGITQF